jgi:hypothetical protein
MIHSKIVSFFLIDESFQNSQRALHPKKETNAQNLRLSPLGGQVRISNSRSRPRLFNGIASQRFRSERKKSADLAIRMQQGGLSPFYGQVLCGLATLSIIQNLRAPDPFLLVLHPRLIVTTTG